MSARLPSRVRPAGAAARRIVLAAALAAVASGGAPPALAGTADGTVAEPAVDGFPILEFRVLGNTVLEPATIERAVYPLLGPDGSMPKVEQAREALVAAYRDAGFGTVFVDIPEQSVDDGVVRLQVTEGRLDRVRITGAEYTSSRELRDLVPTAARGTTPNLKSLQSELLNAARVGPDRQVTPVLRAGRTPGSVDLELKVDDRLPLHGSVELNDRYTADTSELRANALLSYDRLFGRPQSLSLQYQWSPEQPGEVSVWALTWLHRSVDSPVVWVAYAVDSDSDVAALGTLTVLGEGRVYGLRRVRPTDEPNAWLRAWSVGVDYKDFTENVLLTDAESRTPISYAIWSASLTAGRRWKDWTLDATTTLSFAFRGLGNTENEFAFKRFGGRPNFALLRGDLAVGRRLPWGFSAALRSRWQYTPAPVVGNEQFGLGGPDTVRGYLEAEALVDSGVAGTLELLAPTWTLGRERPFGLQAMTFVDAGVGRTEQPLPRQAAEVDLSSWGAGLTLTRAPLLDARVYWARPLVPADRTLDGDDRVHFSFRMGF